MERKDLSKAIPFHEELKQTKRPHLLYNEKGHLTGLFFGIAIWIIYAQVAVPNAIALYKLMKSNGSMDSLSFVKSSIIFPGFLILCLLAGSVHAYIEERSTGIFWLGILPLATWYLLLLLGLAFLLSLILKLAGVL